MTIKNFRMNKKKKGDVPLFILVVGIFLVCVLAIFSFAFFKNSTAKKFEILEQMALLNSLADQARFYENTGQQPESLLNITKKDNYYLIKSEKILYGDRVFYAEYRLPVRTIKP